MFENPKAFWLFLAVPLVVLFLLFDILLIKKRVKKIAGNNVSTVIPYFSEGQRWLKIVFYVIGFCLAIIALARPRWGVEAVDSKVKGRDVLILLDVSYSMAANDVIPTRLDSAKRSITELLELESGDRVGLMIFSGGSELVSPVTHDYAAINFFLDSLYPGMLGKGGTNIGAAITNAVDGFNDEDSSHKMILLITDGENLQGDFRSMLNKVKESHIKIFTAGVGTQNGEPIPIRNSKGEIESYVKDSNGRHVISKLDEKMLQTISKETDGKYLGTTNSIGSLKRAFEYIKSVEKKEQKSLSYEQRKERYDIFLIPALILFCLGFILDQGKIFKIGGNKFDWIFKGKSLIILVIPLLMLTPVKFYSQDDGTADVEHAKSNKKWIGRPNGGFWGNISFKKEKYNKALEQYMSAMKLLKGEMLSRLYYNIGNTYLKLNDLKNAGQHYENASLFAKDDMLKSKIFYNHGITEFKNQDYAGAAELFKKAIEYNPDDDDARYNYVVSKELEKNSKKDNGQSQSQNQQKNKEQQKDGGQKQSQQKKQSSGQLSEEDIQRLLNALDEKEKKENKDRSQEEQRRNSGRVRYW